MTADFDPCQGEKTLWAGAPDPTKLFMTSDVFLLPFGLIWTAIGASIVVEAPVHIKLFGAVIVAASSFLLLIGRFIIKIRTKRATRYVLTNMRAVIIRHGNSHSFDLTDASPHVEWRDRGRHWTLKFTSDRPGSYGKIPNYLLENSGLDFALTPGRDTRFAFYDIPPDEQLSSAVTELVRSGSLHRGIA